jgi:hypothetical protein
MKKRLQRSGRRSSKERHPNNPDGTPNHAIKKVRVADAQTSSGIRRALGSHDARCAAFVHVQSHNGSGLRDS